MQISRWHLSRISGAALALAVLVSALALLLPAATPSTAAQPGEQGRITGTVIEQASQAPAAGVPVQVGNRTLYTDRFGNYDLSLLSPDSYTVGLDLPPDLGTPVTEPVTHTLGGGETIVQHLEYTSPTGAPPVPQPVSDIPNIDTPYGVMTVEPGAEIWMPVSNTEAGVAITPDDLDAATTFETRIVPPEAAPPPNPGQVFVSDLVEVHILDEDGNRVEDVRFAGPIEIRIPLPDAAELNGREPTIFFYDTGAGVWVNLPTTPNGDGRYNGFTDHVTLFALG